MRHLFRVENIDRWDSNWPLGAKMCFFDPKIWIFGAKSQFLFCNRDFCQQSISQLYQGLQLSHSDHPEKNVCFQAMGHFPGLTPFFCHFGPFPLGGIASWSCQRFPTTKRELHKMSTQGVVTHHTGGGYRQKKGVIEEPVWYLIAPCIALL